MLPVLFKDGENGFLRLPYDSSPGDQWTCPHSKGDIYNLFTIKIYFSEKNLAALGLVGMEKGEVITDSAAPKSDFLLPENYYSDPLNQFGDWTDCTKNLS